MVISFLILAIFIVISIIYATFIFAANERAIRRAEVDRSEQLRKTFKDISTTCTTIQNADIDKTTLTKLTKELKSTKDFLKRYY